MEATAGLKPRRSERLARKIPIHVAVKTNGLDLVCQVNTLDISAHGFRVRTDIPLEPGQAIYAKPTGGRLPFGYCRVVWTSRGEAGLAFVN